MTREVTDADVQAAVEKAAKSKRTLNERLDDAHRALGRFARAYAHGVAMLEESESSAGFTSPFSRVAEGLAKDGSWETVGVVVRPTNPPESAAPSGGDRDLRSALIRSTQRLGDAIRTLMFWEWELTEVWEPQALAYTTVRRIDGRHRTVMVCDADGAVCWRPPDESITPVIKVKDAAAGAAQLRSLVAQLQTRDWEQADDIDRDIVRSAVAAAEKAVGTLQYAGVWTEPEAVPRCKVRACNKKAEKHGSGYRDVCSAHRKARQRAA